MSNATILLPDGLVVSTRVILQDQESWSKSFVSAALQAEKLQEIRERSAARKSKVFTVGIAHQEHAHA